MPSSIDPSGYLPITTCCGQVVSGFDKAERPAGRSRVVDRFTRFVVWGSRLSAPPVVAGFCNGEATPGLRAQPWLSRPMTGPKDTYLNKGKPAHRRDGALLCTACQLEAVLLGAAAKWLPESGNTYRCLHGAGERHGVGWSRLSKISTGSPGLGVMPTDISTVRSDQSAEGLRRELAEAREQQAASAEILRVISSSPMDLQRVFAEIAVSAARLCDAYDAAIGQVNGEKIHLVAHFGPLPTTPVVPLIPGALPARAVLERRTIHVPDLQAETAEYPEGSERARRLGFRTILAVPLMRAGEAIGTITIRRSAARPFSNQQIDLLQTFTDQAVIAIENARLFEALQARTAEVELRSAELAESLEYQVATSEVLRAIARAPANAAPVFHSIVETARRLCNAERATLHLKLPDGRYSPEASSGPALQTLAPQEPIPVDRGSMAGRVALENQVVQVDDIQADPAFTYLRTSATDRRRTMLGVPMLRDGTIIGAISISRSEVKRFTEREIALVKTFADQAVIAIENTRLFEEVQARNRELRVALEQQTATSDIL